MFLGIGYYILFLVLVVDYEYVFFWDCCVWMVMIGINYE